MSKSKKAMAAAAAAAASGAENTQAALEPETVTLSPETGGENEQLNNETAEAGAESTAEANEGPAGDDAGGDQAPVAPVSAPAPVQAPVQAAAPAADSLEAVIAKSSIHAKLALQQLLDYMTAMAPKKPVAPEAGARYQVSLFRAIVGIINNVDTDFNIAWGTLLRLFHEHRDGVFAEVNVFRFMEFVLLKPDERKAFMRLLNLIKLTADPKGRDIALRQVTMEETLRLCLTDAGRQKILAFYGK